MRFLFRFPSQIAARDANLPKELPIQQNKCSPTFIFKTFYIEKPEKEVHIYTGFWNQTSPCQNILELKTAMEKPSTQQGRRAHFSSQLFVG